MMSFAPYSFYTPADVGTVSFSPLFRLLDDFDSYSREVQSNRQRQLQQQQHQQQLQQQQQQRPKRQSRSTLTSFQPKFDVRETEHAYELYGDLPGLDRDKVTIEFPEPQTLVIRGRVERYYGSGASSDNTTTTNIDDSSNYNNNNNNIHHHNTTPASRRSSFQATVEDDPEETGSTAVSSSAPATPRSPTSVSAPASGATTPMTSSSPHGQVISQRQEPPRYWLCERQVGDFSRVFTFPGRVDHDAVTASLRDGVLAVAVPKEKRAGVRRIAVN